MRLNKLINKVVGLETDLVEADAAEGSLDRKSLVKLHKKNIKFAEQNFQKVREVGLEAVAGMSEGKDLEKIIKVKKILK